LCVNFFFNFPFPPHTLSLHTRPPLPNPPHTLYCAALSYQHIFKQNSLSPKIHLFQKEPWVYKAFFPLTPLSIPHSLHSPLSLPALLTHTPSTHSLHTLPPHTPPPNSTHRITNPHNHPPNHNQNQRARPQPLPTKHPFTTLSNPPHSTWQTMEPQAAERNINVPVLENVLNW
jgi:hypothetical protein